MANKKDIMDKMKTQVMSKLEESRKQAEREMMKVKKHLDSSMKKVDEYVRKNPEKAVMISAGIGAALAAAVALLMSGGKKGKK